MSNKAEQLIDALSNLTVLEMAELKTALEDKWGVKAAAAAVAVAAPVADKEAAVESSEFQVLLHEVAPEKKISVIKVVREITGLGLKEAKEVVESATAAAPKVLKESAAKAEADEIKTKMEAGGAKITLKGL